MNKFKRFSLLFSAAIFSFPLQGNAQEQVSNIDVQGVYIETNTSSKIGFANIDDEHYMLAEKNSL